MVKEPASHRRKRISSIAEAYRDSHEVMSAALSVAVFVAAGYWLDAKYGWSPLLTICGLVAGCLLATASLRQLLARLDKRSQERRHQPPARRRPEQ